MRGAAWFLKRRSGMLIDGSVGGSASWSRDEHEGQELTLLDGVHLLQRWLDTSGLTQRELAARANVAESAVSNWVRRGRIPFDQLSNIDVALRAAGSFVQLAWASTTPTAVPARSSWDYNFASDHKGAVWAWVRVPEPAEVAIRLRCGVIAAELSALVGGDGLVLTAPVGVANPPVRIEIDPAGWVDFGTGAIPSEAALRKESVIRHLSLRRDRVGSDLVYDDYVRYFLSYLSYWSSAGLQRIADLLQRQDSIAPAASAPPPPAPAPAPAPAPDSDLRVDTVVDLATPPDWSLLKRAREGRSISTAVLASMVTNLADPLERDVTQDRIQRAERGVYEGAEGAEGARLGAKMDRALLLDGVAGPYELEALDGTSGTVEIVFDPWWNGDFWISPCAATELTMIHGWYQKRVVFEVDGGAIWTRAGNNYQPMTVTVDPAVELRWGYGCVRGAADANDRWRPASDLALQQTMEWGERLAPFAFETHWEDFYERVYGRLPASLRRRMSRRRG